MKTGSKPPMALAIAFAWALCVAAVTQIPDLNGKTFHRVQDNVDIVFSQSGSRLTGTLDSPCCSHNISGAWNPGIPGFDVTVTRKVKQDGCVTIIRGYILVKGQNGIETHWTGSNGNCGLGTNFGEVSTWIEKTPTQLAQKTPTHHHSTNKGGNPLANVLPTSGSGFIKATGPYNGPGGFDRGMATTQYCGNNPESWLRASATLDKTTDQLTLVMQLETDSTLAGPKGKATVVLKDARGQVLATASTDEVGIGGKLPGNSSIRNVSKTVDIEDKVAKNTASMGVSVQSTGFTNQIWGIDLGDAIHAFNVAVSAIGSAL